VSLSPIWRPAAGDHAGRWVQPYTDGAGKLRQVTIPREIAATKGSRAEAVRWGKAFLAQQAATGPVAPVRPKGGACVRDLRDRWIELRRSAKTDGKPDYKQGTIKGYEEILNSRILPPMVVDAETGKTIVLGDMPVSAWDEPLLRAWVRALRGQVSTSRCRNVFYTLQSLVDESMAEHWLTIITNPLRSPAVLREVPELKRKSGKDPIAVPLPCLQAVVSCEAVPSMRRVRHLVEACTGLNEGELAGLAWGAVKLSAPLTISVTGAVLVRDTKAQSRSETKNEHRVRTLPLHDEATAALRWWYDVGWPEAFDRHPEPEDPVFPGRGARFARPPAAQHLRDDLEAAGQPSAGVTAQALRRTFATALADAGVPLDVRQALMGHRPETVTAGSYTAAAVERYRASVNLIGLRWVQPRGEERDGEAQMLGVLRDGQGETVVRVLQAGAVHQPGVSTQGARDGVRRGLPRRDAQGAPAVGSAEVTAGLVPDVMPPAQDRPNSGSHLRDLNPRPTVYEAVRGPVPERVDVRGRREEPRERAICNGAVSANGGGFMPAVVPEMVESVRGMAALRSGWDAMEMCLAQIGSNG